MPAVSAAAVRFSPEPTTGLKKAAGYMKLTYLRIEP